MSDFRQSVIIVSFIPVRMKTEMSNRKMGLVYFKSIFKIQLFMSIVLKNSSLHSPLLGIICFQKTL